MTGNLSPFVAMDDVRAPADRMRVPIWENRFWGATARDGRQMRYVSRRNIDMDRQGRKVATDSRCRNDVPSLGAMGY
jgi:hypothetical protein